MSSCAPCAAAAAAQNSGSYGNVNYERTIREVDPNCEMTAEVLYAWRAMLNCMKLKGTYRAVGLTSQELNSILGIVQSAINYPDDYCHYADRYAYFQNTILPLIVTNVPECIQ